VSYSPFSNLKANCSKRWVQQQKIDVCLTLFYSEVQLAVPVMTNVESAVVDTHEVLKRDNQVDRSLVTGRPRSPN